LAEDFNVYRAQTMPVAVGERVLITKNNRKASLTNGDLLEVKAIDQTGILGVLGTMERRVRLSHWFSRGSADSAWGLVFRATKYT
jgi:hypothetical protein